MRVRVLLDESEELLEALQRPGIRLRVIGVGLSVERIEELSLAVRAVRAIEAAITAELPEPQQQVERWRQAALELRDDLLSACQWNLRAASAAEALARITNSDSIDELILDLRELAELVVEHEQAFKRDQSFAAEAQAARASELAEALASADEELTLSDGGVLSSVPELAELRLRGVTFLSNALQEIRTAGRHAFRGRAEARQLFSDGVWARGRSPLLVTLAHWAG